MNIKKSVGLVVLVEIPNEGLAAVLQRRGKRNFEEGGKLEPWPGGCQVTTHGKLEEGENFMEALFREAAEELGENAAQIIREHIGELVEVSHILDEKKEISTFAVKMDFPFIEKIQLGPSTGGLDLVSQNKINDIENLLSFSREEGVRDATVIAMFLDETQGLFMAFKRFSS